MRNGSKNPTGSVFYTAITLFFLCSLLMSQVLASYRLTQIFNEKSRQLYIAKTVKEMFLSQNLDFIEEKTKGTQTFNQGTVKYDYQVSKQQLIIFVDLYKNSYVFAENIQNK
ncbi:MAG: competence type IV pilus minor pilin ComGG [Enterococcus sp.]